MVYMKELLCQSSLSLKKMNHNVRKRWYEFFCRPYSVATLIGGAVKNQLYDFLQLYFSVQKAKGKTQNLWNIPIEMLCLYRLFLDCY